MGVGNLPVVTFSVKFDSLSSSNYPPPITPVPVWGLEIIYLSVKGFGLA